MRENYKRESIDAKRLIWRHLPPTPGGPFVSFGDITGHKGNCPSKNGGDYSGRVLYQVQPTNLSPTNSVLITVRSLFSEFSLLPFPPLFDSSRRRRLPFNCRYPRLSSH